MSRAVCTPLCVLLLASLVSAQSPPASDSVTAELTEARKALETAVAKAKEALNQAFDKAEKSIREDANLRAEQQVDLLRQHRKERDAFEKNGTLPDSPRMKFASADYKRSLAAAEGQLDKVFDKAIKAYTKQGEDAKAETVLGEKKKLLADQAEGRSFQVGAVWEGHHVYQAKKYPAKLTITSRDGEKFEAKLSWVWNNEPEVVTRVEGKFTKEAISFRITKVEKGKGVFNPVDYAGAVDGGVASGTWVHKGPVGEAKGEFKYTPAPKGKQ